MTTALKIKEIDLPLDPEAAFVSLYGESDCAFWLDSSRPGERGRFSFMGDASGPLAEVIRHETGEDESLLQRLHRHLEERCPPELPDFPFEFDCGFVGYLGYELKSECGYDSPHRSEHPDAAFLFADRVIAFDHEQEQTYLLCLHEPGGEKSADDWLGATEANLATLPVARPSAVPTSSTRRTLRPVLSA